MIRTRTVVADRIITAVVGLLLTVVGVAAWLWYYAVPPLTGTAIDINPARTVLAASWWPWAIGALGVVLVLLGLQRLVAHLPARGVGSLRLSSSEDHGRLAVQANALGSSAAREVKDLDGVRTARGRLLRERGQLVVDLVVVVDPGASLADVSTGCDRVATTLAAMSQRRDLTFRVDLRVSRRGRSTPRVTSGSTQ